MADDPVRIRGGRMPDLWTNPARTFCVVAVATVAGGTHPGCRSWHAGRRVRTREEDEGSWWHELNAARASTRSSGRAGAPWRSGPAGASAASARRGGFATRAAGKRRRRSKAHNEHPQPMQCLHLDFRGSSKKCLGLLVCPICRATATRTCELVQMGCPTYTRDGCFGSRRLLNPRAISENCRGFCCGGAPR